VKDLLLTFSLVKYLAKKLFVSVCLCLVSFRLDDFWSSNLELSNAFNTASEFYNIKNEEINEYIKNKIYTKYLSNIRVATVNIKSICIKLNHWRPIDHIS
jgi:hypothetical protein